MPGGCRLLSCTMRPKSKRKKGDQGGGNREPVDDSSKRVLVTVQRLTAMSASIKMVDSCGSDGDVVDKQKKKVVRKDAAGVTATPGRRSTGNLWTREGLRRRNQAFAFVLGSGCRWAQRC